MEYAKTRAAIKSSYVEKATMIQPGKNHLLVYLEDGIPLLLSGGQVVGRQHLVVYLVVHLFFKYLMMVWMEVAFLPTSAYRSKTETSILRKSSMSIRRSSLRNRSTSFR